MSCTVCIQLRNKFVCCLIEFSHPLGGGGGREEEGRGREEEGREEGRKEGRDGGGEDTYKNKKNKKNKFVCQQWILFVHSLLTLHYTCKRKREEEEEKQMWEGRKEWREAVRRRGEKRGEVRYLCKPLHGLHDCLNEVVEFPLSSPLCFRWIPFILNIFVGFMN